MKINRLVIILLISLLFILIFIFLLFFSINANKNSISSSTDAKSVNTIIVDAGHGGVDGGAVGVGGTYEKNINLDISIKLRDLLNFYGFNVIMTRTEDVMTSDKYASTIRQKKISDIYNRFAIIDANPDALFVSIHQNKYRDSSQWGTQVFYSKNNPASKVLAEMIQNSIASNIQPENKRIVKKTGTEIYLLYHAKSPAVLVECGFLSNYSDVEKLKNEKYRLKIAIAIANGIIKYTQDG